MCVCRASFSLPPPPAPLSSLSLSLFSLALPSLSPPLSLPSSQSPISAGRSQISATKVSTPVDLLCKGAPAEFATYLHYCRSLRFDEKPDYAYCKKLFRDLFVKEGYVLDYVFDW
eukprot:SAG22_NODE_975_length_6203_cov_25.423001_7_plen_115_part_00